MITIFTVDDYAVSIYFSDERQNEVGINDALTAQLLGWA